MIAASREPHQPDPTSPEPRAWQRELAEAVTDPGELLDLVGLDREPWLAAARRAATLFPLRVPRPYVARMRRGDANDPLLRQVLPLAEEFAPQPPSFVADPVGDLAVAAHPGVLRKYRGRALLVTTGACAVHCRYCFRREFPYGEQLASTGHWAAAVAALRADTDAREVLLSGGDPLSLATHKLAELTTQLATMPHVERLRIHTRQPIVLPSRVDEALVSWLASLRWPTTIVLHVNHAQELDGPTIEALARLRATRAHLLNQSVLLRGVNDDAATLAALSVALHAAGVLPYYLHGLDPVRGSAHFDVPDDEARRLHEALIRELPGYLVPRLVREVPGAPSKVSISSVGTARTG
ncbi:MAG: EF-P beta-lysylation protein EpmB [Steroidobacteraceae bacterium]|jgi:EF-P beta-lysylation protein EpmB|nr:EF-P beta-lysylation protein EpmB [Steroidobacteraceae bacterium]